MKKESVDKIQFDDHVGCFGSFDMNDRICKNHCALKLKCAIDSDQNDRLELLEELVAQEVSLFKIQ